MSQQNMAEHNIPNGAPPQMRPQYQFNGVHSSNSSSRGSSPAPRLGTIPSSQLPPARPNIPASQLPPSRSPLTLATQKMGQLSVGTPNVSPKFSTSTPNAPPPQKPASFVQTGAFSPITTNAVPKLPRSDVLDNVPLSGGPSNQQVPVSAAPFPQFSGQSQYGYPQAQSNVAPAQNMYQQQYPQQNVPGQFPNGAYPQFPNKFPSITMQQPPQQLQSNAPHGPINGANQTQLPNNNPVPNRQFPPPNTTQSVQPQNYPPLNQTRNTLHNNRYPAANMQQQPPMQQPQPNQPNSYQYQQQNQQFSQPPFSVNPVQQQQQQPQQFQQQPQQFQQPYNSVVQSGFSKFWGTENYDLLQQTNILPPTKLEPPKVHLGRESMDAANCSPDVFRCTMTKIPENNSLLQKSRLPLGVLIHPFKDLNHLPVIQCNVIVRCRTCRTYINPFVYFVDNKRWKCNLCYRINELPEEFQYDPVSKTYGDPSRRPEIKASTIEYIAPAEYMLRPPQPAVYLFLLDVSRLAVESGYLISVCNILLEELKNLPGDARTQIGFIAYDSALHFFSLAEGLSQPHEMTVLDIDDVFLPCPDNLLVNLKDCTELVTDLLGQLPTRYNNTYDTNSCLGAALQAAYKMMSPTGGRITVFQAALPNVGPGALTAREDPSHRTTVEVAHLNPANDFYKRLALECSGQQIAVDLFVVNSQYVDIATISGISRFSGGCINHFPLFKATRTLQCDSFEKCFRRYLTRKIGFEAVMRIRCTRGLAIHTFHGNFFVRSTDLLSLPNINPDAGFGMQVSIEESLSDVQTVCFQAALLYTSSKGERRIRVHTLCLPVASTLQDIIHSADQQCIVGLLSKMAVDRSMQSNLSDAREAFINVAIDILSAYKFALNMGSGQSGLFAPAGLRLLPLYISALLKHLAFRTGTTTRVDDRVKAMMDMKSKPLHVLMQQIYPDLYPIHNLEAQEVIVNSEDETVSMPPRLQLSARCLDSSGAFLMDAGELMIILVCPNVSKVFLNEVLGVPDYNSISDQMYELPTLNNVNNQRLVNFVNYLNDDKPYAATIQIIRDNSPNRMVFFERLIEDRVETALSYHEFLQHLRTQVK
ncbi:protein transport protein Sec24A [Aethina tumida]|uniref:protein transport protein Sec24A n=1 Tax=Aethina tumida TaxID=116153 RepID=UPI00214757E8|nr:protein transport protein Sec24A [Aethina tumida]